MLIDKLKFHLVDATAMITESNPFFAISEIGFAGMSNEKSLNARLIGAVWGYLGFAKVYSGGRNLWKRKWGVDDDSSELVQSVCDVGYSLTFNFVVSPIMYYASGVRDIESLAIATGSSMILGVLNGAPMGFAIDVFEDLTGLKKCKRKYYPAWVKNLGLNTKRKIPKFPKS